MSIRTKILEKGKIVQEQLIRTLIQFDSRISVLEGTDTNDTTEGTIAYRIKSIETAIGKASGTGASGILKDVKDIDDAIGDEDTTGTILYRIKALEDANTTPEEPSG